MEWEHAKEAAQRPNYENPYDLVCIGFGPASLAIAIALHDKGLSPRVLYIEKQRTFVWHAGMILPNARMQISYLKDLATLRDPRSKFTFVNYLKSKNRLVAFTNLSTFLPLREEYNDYMSWCAAHFKDSVQYGQETISVSPIGSRDGPITSWRIASKNVDNNQTSLVASKKVVIAVGGRPRVPPFLSNMNTDSRIIHSSAYAHAIPRLLTDTQKAHSFAVIGGGQSAAEIFNDLQSRYPNSTVNLFTGASALKPSDDSPFVNEIFNPDRVDSFYDLPTESRQKTNSYDKATNYGVVRPELLDRMYEHMYHQRLHEPDESKWQCKIIAWREVIGFEKVEPENRIRLRLRNTSNGAISMSEGSFDIAMLGTGYERNGHEKLLEPARHLLRDGRFAVERDYRVKFRPGAVGDGAGVWLQGCCEESHGLSDTLLSILAVRGGEMVDSIFPNQRAGKAEVAKL